MFLEEEKRLVTTVTPMLATTVDKSQLAEDLRELNMRLVKAAEGERARIVGDLHDGPPQKALLLAKEGGVRFGDPEALAAEIVFELREVCSRLRPGILDGLGIVPAVDWLMEDVSRRTGLSTKRTLSNVGEDDRYPPDVELALFRITQEAANNVAKHAQGTSLEVRFSRESNYIVLQVQQDGVGFSPVSSRRRGGRAAWDARKGVAVGWFA